MTTTAAADDDDAAWLASLCCHAPGTSAPKPWVPAVGEEVRLNVPDEPKLHGRLGEVRQIYDKGTAGGTVRVVVRLGDGSAKAFALEEIERPLGSLLGG